MTAARAPPHVVLPVEYQRALSDVKSESGGEDDSEEKKREICVPTKTKLTMKK
jgi:hypothetical protein